MATNTITWLYDENNSNVVLQCTIPCKKSAVGFLRTQPESMPHVIIEDFKDLVIDALEKRMQSCTSQLMAHIGDIKEVTDEEIIYDTKHGLKHFRNTSYEAMVSAIDKLNRNCAIRLEFAEIRQIQKALYWVELKDTENFSAGQLISSLEALRHASLSGIDGNPSYEPEP